MYSAFNTFKMVISNIKLSFLLISFLVITSCTGQINTSSKIQTTAPSSDTIEQRNYKDPLFFIDGQLCQHLRKIFQDSKGRLWLGTNVYGLMKYEENNLVYLDENEGIGGGRITGILEDPHGHLWFGTASGLTTYDGINFSTFTKDQGLLDNEIWSLFMDTKGKIWVGTVEGLSIFDGEKFEDFPIPKPLLEKPNTVFAKDRIVSIVEDKSGNMWFGTDGFGIVKYDGATFTHFTTEQGLSDNAISEMLVDKKGDIWIGTYFGGVSKFDGQAFTNFTKEGLVKGVEVGGFFEDQNGDIWFAVENNGVYQYDGTTFTHFHKEAGLHQGSILSIYKDRENRFWFGGWGGLFRFDGTTFLSVTKEGPWK